MTNLIHIKDILIQGNNAQRLFALSESATHPMSLSDREDIYAKIGYGKRIVRYDKQLFLVNPDSDIPVRSLDKSVLSKEQVALLEDMFNHHLDQYERPIPTIYKAHFKWNAELDIMCEQLMNEVEPPNIDYLNQAMELIQSIATLCCKHHETEIITRAITDEFTFYPKQKPFTLDEYKSIIHKTQDIAKELPPDIHLVLATFPVIWPDGGIHNCALHVQSPLKPNENPIIHHFSKLEIGDADLRYGSYDNTSDANCSNEQLPAVALQETAVSLNDPNQSGSAIKINTSNGQELMVSVGICLEHRMGIEKKSTHHLIDQLNQHHQSIPIHCSHVITSSSVNRQNEHILSTITHADIMPHKRSPTRTGFLSDSIHSSFSGKISAEVYTPKPIGTLHSDLFQHAIANQPHEALADWLNQMDSAGNTLLHQVFLETAFDRELIARRLYSMILNGGNPDIANHQKQTVKQLAEAIEKNEPIKMITNAIEAALSWQQSVQKINNTLLADDKNLLTHQLTKDMGDLSNKFNALIKQGANPYKMGDLSNKFNALIKQGANPYKNDGTGKNAIDIINQFDAPLRDRYLEKLTTALQEIQYGYLRPEQKALVDSEKSWFMPRVFPEISQFKQPNLERLIQPYFLLLEKIESNNYSIHEIYPAIFKITTAIKEAFINPQNKCLMQSQYDMFTDALMQKLRLRFPMARNFIMEPNANEQDNTALESLVFCCVKDHLINYFQKLSDLKDITKFPPRERALIFANIENRLSEIPFNLKDINILKQLPLAERTIVFDKIKYRLFDKITNGEDLSFMKSLSIADRTFVFNRVKDNIHQLISSVDDLEFLKYLLPEERRFVEAQIKPILPNLVNSETDLLSLCTLSNETCADVIQQITAGTRTLDCIDSKHFLNTLSDQLSSEVDMFILCCDALPQLIARIQPQYPLDQENLMKNLKTLTLSPSEFITKLKKQLPILLNHFDTDTFENAYEEIINPILTKLSDMDRNEVVIHLHPTHQQVIFGPQKKLQDELQRLKKIHSEGFQNDENSVNRFAPDQ